MNVSLRMIESFGYVKIHEAYLGSSTSEKKINDQLKEWYLISNAIKMPAFSISNHRGLLMNVARDVAGGIQALLTAISPGSLFSDDASRNMKRSFARLWRSAWENYAQAIGLSSSQLEMYVDVGLKVPIIYAAVVLGDKSAMSLIEGYIDISDVCELILESGELLYFMNSVLCWFVYIKFNESLDLRNLLTRLVGLDNTTFAELLREGDIDAFNDYCSNRFK